jgi:Delta14-sterol reductase
MVVSAEFMLIESRLGAFGVSFGLPLVTYLLTFLCNDISGCPAPSTLHPSTLTLEKLKEEVGWPANGVLGLVDLKVTGAVLGYYVLSLILYRVLPGEEAEGIPTSSGAKLKYKFNSRSFFGSSR